ncbi:uncharacterized protein LOC100907922 [Galendromus occidentalis]|uniref:Uncharacterized protein LOC100907922 n=1 Tax=Galendromus occidentalis TaxID=34638 RepID=A0AAJ7WJA4_9ACAR|nr:uncharacterized protein LOC100907922 [Galendromus occidentalis]
MALSVGPSSSKILWTRAVAEQYLTLHWSTSSSLLLHTIDPTVETNKLITFVRKRVRQLEATKLAEAAQSASREANTDRNSIRPIDSKHRRLVSTVAAGVAKPKSNTFIPKPCLFCAVKDHNSSKCPAAITIARRHEILRERRRCPRCFRTVHPSPTECRGPRSPCLKCKSPEHYTSMHSDEATGASPAVTVVSSAHCASNSLLWTMCAYVTNHGLRIPVRIFVDCGSSLTFVTPSLRAMLRETPVSVHDLNIQGYDNFQRKKGVPVYKLCIAGPRGEPAIQVLAYESEFGVNPSNISPRNVKDALVKFDQNFPLADRSYVGEWTASPPAILLGMNQWNKFKTNAAPKDIIGDIAAYPTRFGWVVGGDTEPEGPTRGSDVVVAHAVCCVASLALSRPAEEVERLWNLETIGIVDKPSANPHLSADDESALQQFHAGLTYADNRYTVCFPKRSSIEQLPDTRELAMRRLSRKITSLSATPERYERYNSELLQFVADGFAREIDPAESNPPTTYHMPHHEVVNSSGKWRIVFDCSAKDRGGTSLNEHLIQGPNLNPELITPLLRFRTNRVAISADIAKAYMMLAVHEEDQASFRFIWKGPGDDDTRTFQMTRVTWGASPSGFLLAATVREHLRRAGPDAARLGSYFYADDFLLSCRSVQEAKEVADLARRTLASAGMKLAKWKSSPQKVLEHLAATGVDRNNFDKQTSGFFKVLGISWNTETDTFHFSMPDLRTQTDAGRVITKRRALSIIAAFYDPHGWFLPFTLRGKLIIRRLWAVDLQWNDPIPEDVHKDLTDWISELRVLQDHNLPRRFSGREGDAASYHLHMMGDASQKAFAAVAYIEYRYTDCTSDFALVMCKSRDAPREPQSLPRLELLAAVISVRLSRFLIDNLDIEFSSVCYYTDSRITYHWATSVRPGVWKPFANNRVLEIQKHSNPDQWFFVQGTSNVSDLATRGISAESLINCSDWWFGPSWLRSPRERWPISQPQTESSSFEQVSDETRKVVAPVVLSEPAEAHIVRECQQQFLRQEITDTKAGHRPSSSSKLAAHQLFIDEQNILRVRTRLTGVIYTYDQMNPVVIPGESRLTRLLVIDVHRINAHFGANVILMHLREKFWITRARQLVKSVLHKRVVCRRRQGRHAQQIEGALPEFRTEFQAPFAAAGVDFCGPFHTRDRDGPRKTYIALFTCAAIRAVHLEAVPSLSGPQTMLTIRRFLAAHPACTHLISDNAKNFTKASTELKKLFNSVNESQMREMLRGRNIQWTFICPRAPNRGGFYERLIGVLKSCLYKTLGRSLVGYEEFRTILCELAAVINKRPVTYVLSDPDSVEPLTPDNFLQGGPSFVPVAQAEPVDLLRSDEGYSAEQLRHGLLKRTTYFASLRSRWAREYLMLLRSLNATWGSPTAPLAVGEVCLVRDSNRSRTRWDLVRVVEAHRGRDGHVRTYTVNNRDWYIAVEPTVFFIAFFVGPRTPSPFHSYPNDLKIHTEDQRTGFPTVVEGMEFLEKINGVICDKDGRPM